MKLNPYNSLLYVLALVFFFAQGSTAFSQSESLKWKLAEEQKFDIELVQSSESVTKVNSRETSVENITSIQLSWNVLEVADGVAKIEQSLEGIKLEVSNPAIPAQAVKFDTATPDDVAKKEYTKSSRTLLKQLKPLVGLKFHVFMASTGEITKVELPEETTTAINQLPDTMRLRKLFSEAGIKGLMGSAAMVLPQDELKDGDSWTDEKEVTTAFGKFNRKRTYKLVGKKTEAGTDLAEFEVVPEMIEINPTEGETLKGKLISMTGLGKMTLDVKEGYFKSSSFKNTLKTERPYREKNIETVVTNEVQMTVKKK